MISGRIASAQQIEGGSANGRCFVDDTEAHARLGGAYVEQLSTVLGSRGLIVVADPEHCHSQSVASAFEQEGWDVEVASCPAKLFNTCASAGGARGFILELSPEGKARFDYLKLIRRRCPGTRIIVATAYPSFRSAVTAIRMGAHDYTGKPVAASELMQCPEPGCSSWISNAVTCRCSRAPWKFSGKDWRWTLSGAPCALSDFGWRPVSSSWGLSHCEGRSWRSLRR
jgi:CheY-like chemotaxis protein